MRQGALLSWGLAYRAEIGQKQTQKVSIESWQGCTTQSGGRSCACHWRAGCCPGAAGWGCTWAGLPSIRDLMQEHSTANSGSECQQYDTWMHCLEHESGNQSGSAGRGSRAWSSFLLLRMSDGLLLAVGCCDHPDPGLHAAQDRLPHLPASPATPLWRCICSADVHTAGAESFQRREAFQATTSCVMTLAAIWNPCVHPEARMQWGSKRETVSHARISGSMCSTTSTIVATSGP